MEVNSTALKIIVKECCRSLSYNDEERQFSFPLCSSLAYVWALNRDIIRQHIPNFTLADFNAVLSQLESPISTQNTIPYTSLSDSEILNGEVISVKFEDERLFLVKMKTGQYLSATDGVSISFGKQIEFCRGNELVTSEGKSYGKCKEVEIVLPNPYHIALSRVFIGKYYLNKIDNSLWPIYDTAMSYLQLRNNKTLEQIINRCRKSGIGAHSLLYILKGVCSAS